MIVRSSRDRRTVGRWGVASAAALALTATWAVRAQEQPDQKTLLPAATLTAIANEISGALAFTHVMEMTPYERDRPAEEYGTGTYREAAYLAAKAREYGFSDVKIERFPQPQKQWDGEIGELWIEEPVKRLVTRYRELSATLAAGSQSADVTAELVYVGRGDRESDYAGKDVAGKIVLGSAAVGALHNMAVRKFNAAGVASFANATGKPIDRPDQIGWSGLSGGGAAAAAQAPGGAPARTTFGFVLSHRMGQDLIALVERGPKVVVRAKIKATEYQADMQVVMATIAGDGSLAPPAKTEVAFSSHLFEGIAKQGANDDTAGPSVQIEIGRAWIQLIKNGVLPRPKRTVRFLWIPEISGTRAYIQRYPDFIPRVLAAVNMDMVSASQSKNKNSMHLMLTPDSVPSFLNDVSSQFLEFVGDGNREKIHNRRVAYAFSNPILDIKGSRDPFWYHIEKFYGSSDHQVFLDATPRVPAVQFGSWPDEVYHTSEDSPEYLDPTQMKRIAVIGLAIGHVLASAGPSEALNIAGLSAAYGQRRLGEALQAASMAVAQADTGDALQTAYRDALVHIRHAHWRERAGIRSASAMIAGDAAAQARLDAIDVAFGAGEAVDVKRLQALYAARCAVLKLTPVLEPAPTPDEQTASQLVPRRLPPAPGQPAQPQGFGPGGGGAGAPAQALTPYYAMEARNFADGTRSILDIRHAISGEFGPVGVDKVTEYFRQLEKAGGWAVGQKPAPASGKRAKPTPSAQARPQACLCGLAAWGSWPRLLAQAPGRELAVSVDAVRVRSERFVQRCHHA